MKRPFQVGDIVTFVWGSGDAVTRYPHHVVTKVKNGEFGVYIETVDTHDSERGATGPAANFILETPAPRSENLEAHEDVETIEAIQCDVREIKGLLRTLIGLMQTRRGT